jgi:hypothetical protein
MESLRYEVDPNDPRAPSQEAWDRLSSEEQRRVVDSLPARLSWFDANAPIQRLSAMVDDATRRVERVQ